MNRFPRWLLIAALIAVPALGYGVTKYRAGGHCAGKAGCPLAHQEAPRH
ncbi:MAG: hypothetical protein JWN44_5880 [Myxococcales bacterium]|nr:hypothetical protein [Myxococcales bacterium]